MHIANMRERIDFDKVTTLEDLKAILKALEITWHDGKAPGEIRHLIERYDANVIITNL